MVIVFFFLNVVTAFVVAPPSQSFLSTLSFLILTECRCLVFVHLPRERNSFVIFPAGLLKTLQSLPKLSQTQISLFN